MTLAEIPIRGPVWSNATVKRTSTLLQPPSRMELIKIYDINEGIDCFHKFSLIKLLSNFWRQIRSQIKKNDKDDRKRKMEETSRIKSDRTKMKGSKMVMNSADFRKFKEELQTTGFRTHAGTKQIINQSMDDHKEVSPDHNCLLVRLNRHQHPSNVGSNKVPRAA